MIDNEKNVLRMLDTYKSAVRAKNIDTFMKLYDPAVRVFDTWGAWSHEGAPQWQLAIEGWFSSLGDEVCTVTFDDVKISDGHDMASMSAIVTYAAISAQGQPLREMQNRITWVLRVSGHVWRIVHEHTSAPIGLNDEKAILMRQRR